MQNTDKNLTIQVAYNLWLIKFPHSSAILPISQIGMQRRQNKLGYKDAYGKKQ